LQQNSIFSNVFFTPMPCITETYPDDNQRGDSLDKAPKFGISAIEPFFADEYAILISDSKLTSLPDAFFFTAASPANGSKNNLDFFFSSEVFYPSSFRTQLSQFSKLQKTPDVLINESFDLPVFSENDEFFFSQKPELSPYSYLKTHSFISFFIDNLIDVPICFRKSKSLKLKNSELPILKFINILTRDGKRESSNRVVIRAFTAFYSFLKKNKNDAVSVKNQFSWLTFFRFFYTYYFSSFENSRPLELNVQVGSPVNERSLYDFLNFAQADIDDLDVTNAQESVSLNLRNSATGDESESVPHSTGQMDPLFFLFFPNHPLFPSSSLILNNKKTYSINPDVFTKNTFLAILGRILPIFSFFIYNVEKNVRKFSRNKSGKYLFI
jgi:hypothetical protein